MGTKDYKRKFNHKWPKINKNVKNDINKNPSL